MGEKMDSTFHADGPGYIPHRIMRAGPFRYICIKTALQKRSGLTGHKTDTAFQADGWDIFFTIIYSPSIEEMWLAICLAVAIFNPSLYYEQ
jgi:hypothetical protein